MADKKRSDEQQRKNREAMRAVAWLLDRAKITQRDLAERMDVSETTVSKWINGQIPPDLERLLAISALLDLPLYAIFAPFDRGIPVPIGPNYSDQTPKLPGEVEWLGFLYEMTPDERAFATRLLKQGFGKSDTG